MKAKFFVFPILFLFSFIFSLYLYVHYENNQAFMNSRLTGLNSIIKKQNSNLKRVKKDIPNVLLRNVQDVKSPIVLYELFGLKIAIRSERPIFNNENFLSVPAAFTTETDQIDGLFIENGIEINSTFNRKLTGFCIISGDSLNILPTVNLDHKILEQVKQKKNSLFQQFLLVNNSEIITGYDFNGAISLRRALVQFKNSVCIAESGKPISIREFQKSLIKIGAVNALYLDMGTWSEGWYKNYSREKLVIGETMVNTDRQTNWIIYEREI